MELLEVKTSHLHINNQICTCHLLKKLILSKFKSIEWEFLRLFRERKSFAEISMEHVVHKMKCASRATKKSKSKLPNETRVYFLFSMLFALNFCCLPFYSGVIQQIMLSKYDVVFFSIHHFAEQQFRAKCVAIKARERTTSRKNMYYLLMLFFSAANFVDACYSERVSTHNTIMQNLWWNCCLFSHSMKRHLFLLLLGIFYFLYSFVFNSINFTTLFVGFSFCFCCWLFCVQWHRNDAAFNFQNSVKCMRHRSCWTMPLVIWVYIFTWNFYTPLPFCASLRRISALVCLNWRHFDKWISNKVNIE